MLTTTPFYFSSLRNLVIGFGKLFNNISIQRNANREVFYFNAESISVVDTVTNELTIPAHNFTDGDDVVYNSNGGTDIPGLVNGTTYDVNVISNDKIILVGTDITDVGIGVSHKLDPINVKDKIIKVPLSYGPKEKYISLIQEYAQRRRGVDEGQDIKILMPRMAYEITSILYDSTRKLATTGLNSAPNTGTISKLQYNPVPYEIQIKLSVLVKFHDDGFQILEQIFPYFAPTYALTLEDVDSMGIKRACPITILGVSTESIDSYEGNPDQDRIISWEIDFKAYLNFYPPVDEGAGGKIIKRVITDIYDLDDTDKTQKMETITVEVDPFAASEDDTYIINTTITGS